MNYFVFQNINYSLYLFKIFIHGHSRYLFFAQVQYINLIYILFNIQLNNIIGIMSDVILYSDIDI